MELAQLLQKTIHDNGLNQTSFAKSINATLPNQKCAKMTEKESEGKT